MAWHLYIDDSGNREYDPNRNYVSSGRSQHFVYGAVLAKDRDVSDLAAHWRQLKVAAFRDPNVEVKANWLRIQHEREKRYLSRFSLTEDDLRRYSDACYDAIAASKVLLLAAVVDKKDMQTTYVKPWYPHTVAYEILMQRVVQTVPASEPIFVTIDDISGKTPKRNDYRKLIAEHHRQLRRDGSRLLKGITTAAPLAFGRLDDTVKFVNSAHSDLVQVADIVSYCVHRQFRDYGAEWETMPLLPTTLPVYPYLGKLVDRFLCDGERRIQGYGIAKFPLKQRVTWRVGKRKDDAAP